MVNWVCICGTYVKDKRFCPRCKYVRFSLDDVPSFQSEGLNLGSLSNGAPFVLPTSSLNTHVLIAGQTGTGKSRFAMKLVVEAANYRTSEMKVLVVDIEGEWKDMIPLLKGKTEYYEVNSNLRINPFDLEDAGLVRELMRETVFKGIEKEYGDLSAQMNYVLQDTIAMSKNMAELISNVRDYKNKELNSLGKTKTALLVRLDPFMRSPLKQIFLCKKSNPELSKLSSSNVIIDLHALDALVAYNQEIRLIYNTLSTYYLREMLGRRPTTDSTNLFVADEAQLLVPRILQKIIVTESWPATEFATRLRKRGCGLLLITQSPSNLERDIIKNTNTKVVFRLQSLEDVKIIAESTGFTDAAEYQYLSDKFAKMPNRSAIVSMLGQEPFAISTSAFAPLPYHVATVALLDDFSAADPDKTSTDDEVEFLESIESEPFIPVVQRRGYLAWDEERYSRVVLNLVKRGVIEKRNVRLGKGRPKVLYQLAGSKPSIKHEYYVYWIISKLADKGIVCRAEKVGPDIQIPSTSVAINVELGSSNILGNISKALEDYALVIICSDEKAVLDAVSSKTKAQNVLCAQIQDVPALVEKMRFDSGRLNI